MSTATMPAPAPQPKLISRNDAAKALGIHTRNLDKLVAQGKIRARQIGRRVLFSPADLDRFIATL